MWGGRQPPHGVQQGERQLGAMKGVGARGSSGCGHRRGGGECRPQLDLTGRVHGGRGQRLIETEGVVAVSNHGVADAEAFLPVGLEHVGETEALAAHLAGVRLLPGVRAAVALHVGPACEAFPTDLTDVRLLSSVCFHVFVEVLFHIEVLSAPLAHELLVSDVDAHVGTQLVFILEALATVLTLEGFLS